MQTMARPRIFMTLLKRSQVPLRILLLISDRKMESPYLKDKSQILKRGSTYFSSILNNAYPIDETALDALPTLPTVHEMEAPPIIAEVDTAITGLKSDKAAGSDGIPPEVYKHG